MVESKSRMKTGTSFGLLLLPRSMRQRVASYSWLSMLVSHDTRVAIWRSLGALIEENVYINCFSAPLTGPERISIGRGTAVNGAVFHAWADIEVGRNVLLSPGTILQSGSHDINSAVFRSRWRPIKIGDYAWIAQGAKILQGVTIGEGAVVGAWSVVVKDVPPYAVVAGNPAKIVAERQRREFSYVPADWKLASAGGPPDPL